MCLRGRGTGVGRGEEGRGALVWAGGETVLMQSEGGGERECSEVR